MVPSYLGHVITENRHGLVVAAMATQAGNSEERRAALKMLRRLKRSKTVTLGADKSYQEEGFVRGLRAHVGWTPWLRQPNKTRFAVRCKFVDRQDQCNAF